MVAPIVLAAGRMFGMSGRSGGMARMGGGGGDYEYDGPSTSGRVKLILVVIAAFLVTGLILWWRRRSNREDEQTPFWARSGGSLWGR